MVICNRKLLTINGIEISEVADKYAVAHEKKGNTAIFVSIDRNIAGIILIADEIRKEAAEVIDRLKALGMRQVVIFTGIIALQLKRL